MFSTANFKFIRNVIFHDSPFCCSLLSTYSRWILLSRKFYISKWVPFTRKINTFRLLAFKQHSRCISHFETLWVASHCNNHAIFWNRLWCGRQSTNVICQNNTISNSKNGSCLSFFQNVFDCHICFYLADSMHKLEQFVTIFQHPFPNNQLQRNVEANSHALQLGE